MGEEEVAEVAQDADAECVARGAHGSDVGHLVLSADVVVALLREEPALAPFGALAWREQFEDDRPERHQAGRDIVARVGDTEVELEAEPIDEVVDRALVPVDDSVDMVELAQLEPGGTSRHRSALAMISSP
jgi:hypothetical protein